MCGGGFNEYKYNLSFQNLIQLKSKSLFLFELRMSGCLELKFGYEVTGVEGKSGI